MYRFICLVLAWSSHAFTTKPNAFRVHDGQILQTLMAAPDKEAEVSCSNRRSMLLSPFIASIGIVLGIDANEASAADGILDGLVGQLKESSKMLDDIPDLIKAEQWDAGKSIQFYMSIL